MPTIHSQFKCPRCSQSISVPAAERDVNKIFCTGEKCAFWFAPDGRILSLIEAHSMPETSTLRDVFAKPIVLTKPKDVKTGDLVIVNGKPHIAGELFDLIVWDLETTGFVAPESRILELGALIFKNGKAVKRHWIFQNNCEIPEKITEITGITKEIIDADGRDPAECLHEFLAFVFNAKKNVTHNGIRFDIPFLVAYAADVLKHTAEESLELRQRLESTCFDTAVHFKAKKLGMGQMDHESFIEFGKRIMEIRAYGVKYNLALCAEEMKIDLTGIKAHRAMADVEVTHKIYQAINTPVSVVTKDEELPF